MNEIVENMLMHYGVSKLDGAPVGSGRYPRGSGENPYQHRGDFLSRVEKMKKEDYIYTDENGKVYRGETAIAKSMGMSTTELRVKLALAKDEQRSQQVATAKDLRDQGYSLAEIAQKMGFANDSSVRSLLNEDAERRMNQSKATADILKRCVDEKGMIDVGTGVERELGISREKLNEALYILKEQGYEVYGGGVPQVTNKGKQTNLKVLCPPGTEHREIFNYENVHTVRDYISHDNGETFDPTWVYPKSMDSSRLQICYAEDGGTKKDGVIEIRRGVDDLSLGESHYAQVRILVDGTHYLKGMAIYSDDLPEGVDIRFNTNKKKGTPALGAKDNTVLKPIKNDPENPFGSLIKEGINDPDKGDDFKGGQSYYYDKDGKKQLSLINKRSEEGDWGEWSNKLSAQFLAKQNKTLVSQQLKLAIEDKEQEYDDICELTNPTVKKALLKSFSEDCDTAAVHLYAAALPRQQYQVILPIDSLGDNEVYAPNYKDGETVALVRYPHGGTFEIPILKVNNKHAESRDILGTNPKDAIGINSKVAERLSGADFDGDTVMVIPCNSSYTSTRITSTPPLEGLKGFDPKLEYGGKPKGTYKAMTKANTQKQMGIISNLITDMTIKGATEDELARAVRHSMVVIDAEKHGLDYIQSEKDNGIAALKKKYQGRVDENGRYHEGASTLISMAKSKQQVTKRKGSPTIDPETGDYIWKTDPDAEYTNYKTGKKRTRTQDSTKMAETRDARTLISSSDSPIEHYYADYANSMKDLARKARLSILSAGKIEYSSTAKETYQTEVKSLMAKLNVALLNAPRERQAQAIANSTVAMKKRDNPDMTKAEIKKVSQQALTKARTQVGAKRAVIEITDKEWEAIQAGAISEYKLTQIINNANIDTVRQLAMPRSSNTLSQAKRNKITSMSDAGYTTSEIAEALNISPTTVTKYL